jgi:metal-sulfur cluster biosynthetic enzyme
VVDLGLIYNVAIENEGDVTVEMTLTAQGCPSHTEISRDIRMTILSMNGVNTCKVNVVWDPPWTPQRISQEGRQKLGIEDE